METSKISRSEAIEKLAEALTGRGSIANIPGIFLQDAKTYLALSDADLAQWYGTSRTNILRKRNTAAENKSKTKADPPTQEPRQAPGTIQGDDIPSDFCDMPTEEKIRHIQKRYDQCLDGKEALSKEQIAALKARLEDLRTLQAEETREGKELISKLLNVMLKDWIRDFKISFEASFSTLKADIARHTLNAILDDQEDIRKMFEAEDKTIFKDSILHRLHGIIAGLGTDFDPVQIFSETAKKHELIKLQIDKYLARQQHEKPRLVGGGSVASPDSIQGGAQARQSAKEELRQQAANRMKAL